jgi:hypothetical protein
MRNVKQWCEQKSPLGLPLLPWLIPAVSALFLKHTLLCIDGYRESALGLRASGVLTLAEKLLLFQSDMLLGFVLVPLALCCVTFFLPLYGRLAASALLALMAEILMTLEAAVYDSTKGFATVKTLWAVMAWALARHEGSIIWVPPLEIAGLFAWVLAAVLFIGIAFVSVRESRRWMSYACLAISGPAPSQVRSVRSCRLKSWPGARPCLPSFCGQPWSIRTEPTSTCKRAASLS